MPAAPAATSAYGRSMPSRILVAPIPAGAAMASDTTAVARGTLRWSALHTTSTAAS
ncbi:hypothetical protein ACFQGX_02545 [Nonomuraea dietziae]|uniref:hypothetical protein n=1 Tax=Nonomuraea dietziae TaxID=65515 RepID=UPI00360AE47A